MREALDRITDCIYALDRQGRITYLNKAIERTFGLSRDEALGHIVWERFPGIRHTPLYCAIRQALAEGATRHEEFYYPAVGRWYETRIFSSPEEVSVFFRDVTEWKQMQQELFQARAAAESGVRAKSRILGTMSHELRTPLRVIVGYAYLILAGDAGQLTALQAEGVGAIRRAASRMTSLIDELLALSRTESDIEAALVAPDELRRVVEQVHQEMAPHAVAKYVALRVALPPTRPDVRGDLMRLHRILLNLVGNAIKFTDVGEVTISAEVMVGEVAITVRDTGIGIAADVLPQIFDGFFQADSSTTRRFEVAGLGLALARRFAAQIGGRLTVTSQPGFGSAFTLYLAIASPATAS